MASLVRDYDIDWYEEDFNIPPNPYLEAAAEPDRWGMKEMRFIEGHFALPDGMRGRVPDWQIPTVRAADGESTWNRFSAATACAAITTAFPKRPPSRRRIKATGFSIGSRFKGA